MIWGSIREKKDLYCKFYIINLGYKFYSFWKGVDIVGRFGNIVLKILSCKNISLENFVLFKVSR